MKYILPLCMCMLFLLEGCPLTCDPKPPELYFKPVRKGDNRLMMGPKGIFPTDSIKVFQLMVTNNTLYDVTEKWISTTDSLIGCYEIYTMTIFVQFGSFDTDTLFFEANKRSKYACAAWDLDFTYNGNPICRKCDLERFHTVEK